MLRVVLRRVVLSTALLACTALPPKQPQPLAAHPFLSCHPLPLADCHARCRAPPSRAARRWRLLAIRTRSAWSCGSALRCFLRRQGEAARMETQSTTKDRRQCGSRGTWLAP